MIDDQTGLPFKNTKGTHAGRNQYIPVFHPLIAQLAGQMAARISSQVKDDPTVGVDVTALNPKVTDPPNPALAGAMWARHDGSSSVDQTPGVQAGDSAVMVLTQQGPQNGLEVEPTVTGTGQPHVSVELKNWYVRFLGVYLQFLAPDGKTVLQLANIPEYVAGTIIADHDTTGDTATEMFISVLGPHLHHPRDPDLAGVHHAELQRSCLGQDGPHPGEWHRVRVEQLPRHAASWRVHDRHRELRRDRRCSAPSVRRPRSLRS